jgi:hypothetical protein
MSEAVTRAICHKEPLHRYSHLARGLQEAALAVSGRSESSGLPENHRRVDGALLLSCEAASFAMTVLFALSIQTD